MNSSKDATIEEQRQRIIIELFCEHQQPIGTFRTRKGRTFYTFLNSRFAHIGGALEGSKDGLGGLTSIKSKNITLNMKKLLSSSFDSMLDVAVAFGDRNTLVLTAIRFCQKLYELRKINIEERHAIVMIALWEDCNSLDTLICDGNLLNGINRKFEGVNRILLTSSELSGILSDLDALHCIRLNSNGTIELLEKIKGANTL